MYFFGEDGGRELEWGHEEWPEKQNRTKKQHYLLVWVSKEVWILLGNRWKAFDRYEKRNTLRIACRTNMLHGCESLAITQSHNQQQ